MYHQPISEQNEDSLSLHEHTVIQIYNDLDYSDEQMHSASSNDHSLSHSQCIELRKISQIHQIQDVSQRQQQQLAHPSRQQNYRPSFRHIKNIESKYDIAVSPSTKDELSISNPNQLLPRKSNPLRPKPISDLPDIYSDQNGSNDEKHNSKYRKPQEKEESDGDSSQIESGRQARLSRHPKHQFNINNFLNAQPIALQQKKGINVLNKSTKEQFSKKHNRPKLQYQKKQPIKQQDSIVLITLPQIELVESAKMVQKIKNAQNELMLMGCRNDRRFKQARLSFIDNFMPQSLKIKSNPYNLFKYITRSYH